MPDQPPVQVTTQDGSGAVLAQILLKQGEMSTNIALIQQKLESLPISDHESRLRILEQFKYKLMGAAIMVSAFASGAGALVDWALTHH